MHSITSFHRVLPILVGVVVVYTRTKVEGQFPGLLGLLGLVELTQPVLGVPCFGASR